jgi:hypothetical protein
VDRWQAFKAFAERVCPRADYPIACDAANAMFFELANLLDLCFEQWGES